MRAGVSLIINLVLFLVVSMFIDAPKDMDRATYMTGYYLGGICMYIYFLIDFVFSMFSSEK